MSVDITIYYYQLLEFNFSRRILFRRPGFALPLDNFITCIWTRKSYWDMKRKKKHEICFHSYMFHTWPAKKPCSLVLPPRYCSTCFGFSAITFSTIFSISTGSTICHFQRQKPVTTFSFFLSATTNAKDAASEQRFHIACSDKFKFFFWKKELKLNNISNATKSK